VKCRDGTFCPLKETFLPIEDLLSESKGVVPFLDVPEPSHARWQILKHIHVGVKRDVVFYLRCLDKISSTDTQRDQVPFFLEQIQARYKEDESLVRLVITNAGTTDIPC
jgi:hypothetical protein